MADRLRTVYGIDRRCKKWWHRLFWGLLEIAFVNSYVIYCEMFEKISLKEYRRSVALGLISYTEPKKGPSVKRSRSSETPE